MFSIIKKTFFLLLLITFNLQAQESNSDATEPDYSSNFSLDEGQKLPRSASSKQYLAEIEKVLSGDNFSQQKTVERWRVKQLGDDEKEARREKYPEWMIKFIEAFEAGDSSIIAISKGVELLLWTLLVGLIMFFFIRYREQLGGVIGSFKNKPETPDLPSYMFGLDIEQESLPEDVVEAARSSWATGQPREAIAVLLRASLLNLIVEHQCRFYDSDTESECCDRIDEQVPEAVSVYMRKLVSIWQSIAYAHITPNATSFDELCQQWRKVF